MKRLLFFLTVLTLLLNTCLISLAETKPVFDPNWTPQDLKIELKTYPDGRPYFYLTWLNSQGVLDMISYWDENGESPLCYYVDVKIDEGSWQYDVGLNMFGNSLHAGYDESGIFDIRFAVLDPENQDYLGNIDIKSNYYSFRVCYSYSEPDSDVLEVQSAFSKPISIGTPSYYQAASEWAKPELQQASEAGLIPSLLVGADMTKPITREEFCELALALYEKTTNLTVEPFAPNPFKDTVNAQILKAYALGITNGTSETTFEPQKTINRQECATMLLRALKKITPTADFSIADVTDFPDQKEIDNWAVEAAKYMSKIKVVKGDAYTGNFMPKASAAREAAIAMSLRIYQNQKP